MSDKSVALFIPCLVDQVYPEMGLAMVRVLEHLGYKLAYDPKQTCCGQPAFNSGNRGEALAVARNFVDVFRDAEVVVCPSGSCTAMVRNFFPVIFENDPRRDDAVQLGARVLEFSEFLARRGDAERIHGKFTGKVGFHNSCHALRELRLVAEPFDILRRVDGCEFVQPDGEPVCCGFGGLFSVKFAAIAGEMARTRLVQFASLGVETLVSNDPGCVMHMRQECAERDIDVNVVHTAEFLASAMGLETEAGRV